MAGFHTGPLVELEFGDVGVFCGERKTKEKNIWVRVSTNNKFNPHDTKPGPYWWEARAQHTK